MRKLQIAYILPLLLVILFSAGIVSALNSSDASAQVFWSSDILHPASNAGFRITFISNTDDQLTVQLIGVHFDWMADGAFSGKDLSNDPQTIPARGNYTSDPIMIQIPFNVSVGSHTYFVGVDGVDSSGNFTWSGPNQTIQVTYTSTSETSPTPNPTPTPGGSGGQAGSPPNITTYLLIVAVVAIVIAVAAIVMELRKKTKQVNSVADKTNPVTDQPQKDNYDI